MTEFSWGENQNGNQRKLISEPEQIASKGYESTTPDGRTRVAAAVGWPAVKRRWSGSDGVCSDHKDIIILIVGSNSCQCVEGSHCRRTVWLNMHLNGRLGSKDLPFN